MASSLMPTRHSDDFVRSQPTLLDNGYTNTAYKSTAKLFYWSIILTGTYINV